MPQVSFPYWTLLLVAWVAAGVGAVVLVLYRRGHREGSWLLLGAVLGPLILPIAVERVRKDPQPVERWVEPAVYGVTPRSGPSLLIGIDGSPESEEAARVAARLAAPVAGRLVLVTVVSRDAVESGRDDELAAARELLSRRQRHLSEEAAVVETHIVAGQPAAALLELADAEDIDLIVVGRRGKGVSRTVLGSAATTLSSRARCPVVLTPAPDAGSRT